MNKKLYKLNIKIIKCKKVFQPASSNPSNDVEFVEAPKDEIEEDAHVIPFTVAEEVANLKHGFEVTDSFLLKVSVLKIEMNN